MQTFSIDIKSEREKINYVADKSIRFYGCFACHDIPGYEDTKPIGTELTYEGAKTIDKCVLQAEKDRIEFIDVLKNPKKMDIRGKQADALFKFYNTIIKYNELLYKLSAIELVSSLIEELEIFFCPSTLIFRKFIWGRYLSI